MDIIWFIWLRTVSCTHANVTSRCMKGGIFLESYETVSFSRLELVIPNAELCGIEWRM